MLGLKQSLISASSSRQYLIYLLTDGGGQPALSHLLSSVCILTTVQFHPPIPYLLSGRQQEEFNVSLSLLPPNCLDKEFS